MVLSIDDPRLVASFRAGENDAFETLVRAHRPALYRHALRKLSDHAAAEDAVQETFTRAYKSRARVGDDWRLGAWLHQILANVCIDEANRRKRESTKGTRWATAEVNANGVMPALEDQLGLDADHSDVVRALRELPNNYQEALELRFVAELEYDEMAEVLEISEENVRARVSRASKAIRVLLRPVAAIIAFFAAFSFRRGGKGGRVFAATAESAGSSANTVAAASNMATQVSHTASMFAPLVETAQAVAIQAPQAMPLISKAAIGIGMVVVATSPATAPIVIDQFRDTSPAPVTIQASASEPSANTVVAGGVVQSSVAVGPGETVASVASTVAPAGGVSATPSTVAAPGSAIVVVGDGFAAPTSLPAASVATTVVSITRSGGQLSIAVLTSTPSGPRLDLTGSGSLVVGGTSYTGSMTGRTAVSGSPDSRGRQRLEASFVFVTADGPVEIRIAGFATAPPAPASGDVGSTASPTAFAINGVFKAVSDKVPLALTGTASGTLGTGLSLVLSP